MPAAVGERHDLLHGCDGLLGRHALVRWLKVSVVMTTRLTSSTDVCAARVKPRPLSTRPMQGHVAPAVTQGGVGAREDRLRVGHLRHPLRVDEGRGLDPGEAGIGAATYELDLVRRRQLGGVVLEAVPRGDLDDWAWLTTPRYVSAEAAGDVVLGRLLGRGW